MILSLVIIAGCRTTKQEKIKLPPKPERQFIEAPKNLKECAEVINYYEHLVQEWEQWGEIVTEIVE